MIFFEIGGGLLIVLGLAYGATYAPEQRAGRHRAPERQIRSAARQLREGQ